GQIEQIVMNLAVNARDAMPRGGTVTLRTGQRSGDETWARAREIAAGSYAFIEVTDTGTGMDEAVLARIFEPFFTTKEVGKGTGLGLSTVFGIAKQSGGAVEVTSTVGKGSTFTIHLPVTSRRAASAPPGSAT